MDNLRELVKSIRPQNRWKPVDKNVYVVNGIVLAQKKDKSGQFKGYILCKDHTLTPDEYERYINISDINSQSHWKPSAWSEEDKQYLLVCKNALYRYQSSDQWDAGIIIRWLENKLKSLIPQSYWKPSEEQMEALEIVCEWFDIASPSKKDIIKSLVDDLKLLI